MNIGMKIKTLDVFDSYPNIKNNNFNDKLFFFDTKEYDDIVKMQNNYIERISKKTKVNVVNAEFVGKELVKVNKINNFALDKDSMNILCNADRMMFENRNNIKMLCLSPFIVIILLFVLTIINFIFPNIFL